MCLLFLFQSILMYSFQLSYLLCSLFGSWNSHTQPSPVYPLLLYITHIPKMLCSSCHPPSISNLLWAHLLSLPESHLPYLPFFKARFPFSLQHRSIIPVILCISTSCPLPMFFFYLTSLILSFKPVSVLLVLRCPARFCLYVDNLLIGSPKC